MRKQGALFFRPNGGVKNARRNYQKRNGRKTVKIDGKVIDHCAEVNIYETPGKPTEVEIILIDVNVRIENQADSTDERAS